MLRDRARPEPIRVVIDVRHPPGSLTGRSQLSYVSEVTTIDFDGIARCLYDGDAPGVVEGVRRALDGDGAPEEILRRGLLDGMARVGEDFQAGELFVPELIVAARAMHAGLDELRPRLAGAAARPLGTIVIGTVKGDLHDIGKRLVGIMMEGAGLRVVDLGHDVAPERFVEAARDEAADLVGLSALLSTTMPMMRTTLEALRGADLPARVLVGGAPVTAAFADDIGADGYARDAVAAATLARELLG